MSDLLADFLAALQALNPEIEFYQHPKWPAEIHWRVESGRCSLTVGDPLFLRYWRDGYTLGCSMCMIKLDDPFWDERLREALRRRGVVW